ncbi:MAG: C-GCAxxG-C-C family (seleno)protein [Candidatus Thorarchaeota archaeon]|jgi:C_GCAxxG_C_C family probable redox protein
METRNNLTFNCAESVLLKVEKVVPIPNFDSSMMRVASLLGGGIAGSGIICGAVSSGIISIGLIDGTDGTEDIVEFKKRRKANGEMGRNFLDAFVDNWGALSCSTLKSMDKGELSPMGLKRDGASTNRSRCEEYVQWTSDWIIEYMKRNSKS